MSTSTGGYVDPDDAMPGGGEALGYWGTSP
jgi:hypothetical protein